MRKILPSQKIKIENEGAIARTSSLLRHEDKEALDIIVNVESIRFIDLLRKLRWSDNTTSEVLLRFLVKGWISLVDDNEELKEDSLSVFPSEEKDKNYLQELLNRYSSEDDSFSLIPVYNHEPIETNMVNEVSEEELDAIDSEKDDEEDVVFLPETPQMSEEEINAQTDALLKAMGLSENQNAIKKAPLSIPEYGLRKNDEKIEVEEALVSSQNIPSSPSPNKRIPTKDLSEAALIRRNNRAKFLEEGRLLNSMRQQAHEKTRLIKEKEEENKAKRQEDNKAAKEKQKEDFKDTILGRAERLRALRMKKEQQKDG